MGGKNAMIVDTDADLDEAVKGAVDSAFGYAGQKCSAGSRAIVMEGIYDQFLNRLVEATRSLTVAPADDPGASLGPVIDAEARDRILQAIERGKSEGRLVYQADLGPLMDEGFFVPPTIIADVPADAWIAQEEVFGPVLSVIECDGVEDAIRIANGIEYGLSTALYSRDVNKAFRAIRDLEAGITYVNAPTIGAEVHLPFGGVKQTGNGHREGGTGALDFYTTWKSVYIDYSDKLQRAQIDNAE